MKPKLVKLINVCLEKNIPFVAFRLPFENTLYTWLQASGRIYFYENFQEVADQSGFVYAPFHRRTNFPLVFFKPELIFENDHFDESLIEEIGEKEPLYPGYLSELPFEADKDEYLRQAEHFIGSFNSDFTKAVLSRVQLVNKPGDFDIGLFFFKLQKFYPQAFCHLIHIPGTGTWAGATPETLIRSDKNRVQTVSLAGTQSNFALDNPLDWKEKEMEEQQIVTDYIEHVLKKFGVKDFRKEATQQILAGNAVHLATKFNFDKSLIDNQFGQFVSELHPTPAVCGFPKEKALDLIFHTEKHNREYYAGFCGPISMNEQEDLFVNLRCMKVFSTHLALFAGGGLTARSKPEDEWQETSLKANTLLSIL